MAKYKVGDVVFYRNSNGVRIGERTIVGIKEITYSDSGIGYLIEPTDTPCCAVKEECLTPLKRKRKKNKS